MIKQHNQKQLWKVFILAQVSEASIHPDMAEGSEGNSRDGGGQKAESPYSKLQE